MTLCAVLPSSSRPELAAVEWYLLDPTRAQFFLIDSVLIRSMTSSLVAGGDGDDGMTVVGLTVVGQNSLRYRLQDRVREEPGAKGTRTGRQCCM